MRRPGVPIAEGVPWDPLPGLRADRTHYPAGPGPAETTFPLLYHLKGLW